MNNEQQYAPAVCAVGINPLRKNKNGLVCYAIHVFIMPIWEPGVTGYIYTGWEQGQREAVRHLRSPVPTRQADSAKISFLNVQVLPPGGWLKGVAAR